MLYGRSTPGVSAKKVVYMAIAMCASRNLVVRQPRAFSGRLAPHAEARHGVGRQSQNRFSLTNEHPALSCREHLSIAS